MLVCPICGEPLLANAQGMACINRHQFDRAKSGYLNLLPVQFKKSLHSGDTPESLKARREFLQQGFYAPLKQAITQHLKPYGFKSLVDLGCGEGDYTAELVKISEHVFGVDIAKSAIELASKQFKQIPELQWLVASSYRLPFASERLDAITSIFAPVAIEEKTRILKQDGILCVVRPQLHHLYEFREALFDMVKLADLDKQYEEISQFFEFKNKQILEAPLLLQQQDLQNLLTMTPYTYKATLDKKQKLLNHAQTQPFHTIARFEITIWQKKSCD